ncbi:MAG TPA: helix-turn-helix domain-containing protein [Nocardioides sp.]|uniref:helix-turn-helix domain-containing protein n=1 Tax=Nocardioides sp. TaxID=35761 RepID=UPI002E37C224|nr:helix-turn-helix domain-containing protein [Nocardioides sp.]HEX5087553.1 helix-turn-helix domain-containing protein [Nocardioides sp.]
MSPELAHQLTALDPAVLGARIRAARVAAGLTQPELAGPDASVGFVSRIESGQRRPNVELLGILAARLGVTVEFLVLGDGWEDAQRLELLLDHADLSLAGGEADNALRLAREALGSPGLDTVPGGTIRARYAEAAALDALGDPTAVGALQQLLNDAPEVGTRLKVATALCRIWREQGQFERAIAVAQRLVDEQPPDVLGSEEGIRLSVTLAAALFMSGRAAEAAELCDRAIAESERLSSPVARASAYWNASAIRAEAGDVAGALPLAKRALHLLENTERVRDVGRLRIQLSSIMLRADPPRLEDAKEQIRMADLELDWSEASPVDRARNGLVRAQALLLEGQAEEAQQHALQVLADADEELPLVSVDALVLLGQVAWSIGDHEDAKAWYRRAIVTLTGAGADREAAQVWFEIGTLAAQAGLVAESADAFHRAAASAGLTSRLPVVTPPASAPRTTPEQVPAGRVPVIGTPPEGSPRTTPSQSPSSLS